MFFGQCPAKTLVLTQFSACCKKYFFHAKGCQRHKNTGATFCDKTHFQLKHISGVFRFSNFIRYPPPKCFRLIQILQKSIKTIKNSHPLYSRPQSPAPPPGGCSELAPVQNIRARGVWCSAPRRAAPAGAARVGARAALALVMHCWRRCRHRPRRGNGGCPWWSWELRVKRAKE